MKPRACPVQPPATVAKLVRDNDKLVWWALSRFFPEQSSRDEELAQAGRIGLWRAAQLFDPTRGNKFSTYSLWWIRQGIDRAIKMRAGGDIHIPVHCHEKKHQGRVRFPRFVYLDAPVRLREGWSEAADSWHSRVVRVEATQEATLHQRDMERFVAGLLRPLNRRLRLVLKLRWGLGGGHPMTYRLVARRMGISYERVRQLEAVALMKLKEKLNAA